MKYQENEIITIIEKLQNGEGNDIEQEEWIHNIRESVPYYEQIINLLFWCNDEMTAVELLERAKKEYNPIILQINYVII